MMAYQGKVGIRLDRHAGPMTVALTFTNVSEKICLWSESALAVSLAASN
jgi:hypothetical protein